jgi:glycosyltransferase involved in cell wall biosynthesis
MIKKKLIIFMPSIEFGGVEKNLFIISNYLANKFKNTILITASKSHNSKFKNLKVINPIINTKYLSSRRLTYFFCIIELIKILIKDKNYLLLAFQANLYCTLICKFFKTKVVIRSNSSPSGWNLNYFRKTIFSLLLKLPDQIIVNSKEFKKEYKEKFKISTICIYNPLNKEYIKKKSKEKINDNFFKNYNNLKLIFIGRLVDQKDPLTFIKALKIIQNKIKYRCLIIGNGIYYNEIKNYIQINKMHKNVKLLRWKNNPFKYLKSSDLLVLSSKFEGLPNVIMEAISLKKFVISSNCKTGPREILDRGAGGFLYNVGDYKTLAKKIIFFSNNKKICNKKIKHAYDRLNRFDLKKNLNLYYKIISKIISFEK